jgi:cobalt-zinc-cadmium resistance protein CzcA
VVLQQLLGLDEAVEPVVKPLYEGGFSSTDSTLLRTAARARYSEAAVSVAKSQGDLVAAESAPTFTVGVFGQYLANGAFYPGWQLGMNIPLVRKALSVQQEAARTDLARSQAAYRQVLLEQQTAWGHLLHEQEKYQLMLDYYTREGKQLAAVLIREGEANYLGGEISFSDFILLQEQAAAIETGHLEDLLGLNQTIIAMEALTGR